MNHTPHNSHSAARGAIIARLACPPRASTLHPIAGRFVHALRLIALHNRVGRDPVPELATRLGGVDLAARALVLVQVVQASWPENIHVSPFCCGFLSHNEATIGAIVASAATCDRGGFERATVGFIAPEAAHNLWEAALQLVEAELRAV